MDFMHFMGEMYLYFAVKIPLYAYESIEDMKESMPYHSIRWDGVKAKVRRTLGY